MWLLDTSVLVAAFTSENDTSRAQAWLAANDTDAVISPWNIVEFTSALSAKVRQGFLSKDDHPLCQIAFDAYVRDIAFVIPIGRRHFDVAAALCGRSDLPLRAGDAMHIALAREIGAGIVTFDMQQRRAAALNRIMVAEI